MSSLRDDTKPIGGNNNTSLPTHRIATNTTAATTANNQSSMNEHQQPRYNHRMIKNIPHIRRTFTIRICPTAIQNRWNRLFSSSSSYCQWNFEVPETIRHFQCTRQHIVDVMVDVSSSVLEMFVYCIGPLLIALALSIAALLSYTFFTILLPMMYHKHQDSSPYILYTILGSHCSFVALLLINILFNYACCVMQKHVGHHYDCVIYELASITNVKLPITHQEIAIYRRELYEKLATRMKEYRSNYNSNDQQAAVIVGSSNSGSNKEITQRKTITSQNTDPLSIAASTTSLPHEGESSSTSFLGTSSEVTSVSANSSSHQPSSGISSLPAAVGPVPRAWMLLGPYEWGFCSNTQQAKPPRAHYDHVTRLLVLNLDHYCPWMFNAVGYFNYRYFVNFLMFTLIGMLYGATIMCEPFFLLKSPGYRHQQMLLQQIQQHMQNESSLASSKQHEQLATGRHLIQRIRPMMPFRDEKIFLTLSFMLCVAVGVALIGLGGFHIYLVSSGQTTIEFHGNWSLRKRHHAASSTSNGKTKKTKWKNPYSRGTILANWQQVYGVSKLPILQWMGCGCCDNSYINLLFCIIIPNRRLPEYLPLPIPGCNTLRTVSKISNLPNEIDGIDLNDSILNGNVDNCQGNSLV